MCETLLHRCSGYWKVKGATSFNHYRYNKFKKDTNYESLPRSYCGSQGGLVPWHFNTVWPKINLKKVLTVLMLGHHYLDSLIVSDLIGQMKGKINWFC